MQGEMMVNTGLPTVSTTWTRLAISIKVPRLLQQFSQGFRGGGFIPRTHFFLSLFSSSLRQSGTTLGLKMHFFPEKWNQITSTVPEDIATASKLLSSVHRNLH